MMLLRLVFCLCALIGCALANPSPLLKKVIVKQPIFIKPAPIIVHRPVVVKKFVQSGGWW
ncbi:AGAP003130-PA-like protein [Anopheles sinensis]|uniref:AGAP003130-PA-like protein n=1 Tax=Anopheles sinensis TaxID=74873 RepID=A0A084VZW3_ANOSI|nr:AGAP003130-PA-like protein [Anopheles sinensis]